MESVAGRYALFGYRFIVKIMEKKFFKKGHQAPKNWRVNKFNMSHSSKIKHECEKIYGIIKRAEERLKELREKCKHENTHQGLYSSRVGSITEAIICSDCGSLIKNVINNNIRIE